MSCQERTRQSAPRAAKSDPRATQDRPRAPLGPRGPKTATKAPKIAAKASQVSPQRSQDRSKSTQAHPKRCSRPSPEITRGIQDSPGPLRAFPRLSPEFPGTLPKSSKRFPRSSPNTLSRTACQIPIYSLTINLSTYQLSTNQSSGLADSRRN